MSKSWRYILPCYLFILPMSMAGFVIATLFYKASNWFWYDGILTCIAGTYPDGTTRIYGKPMGQTLGWIQIYDSHNSRCTIDMRVHENAHVGQAFYCSLIGLALVPLLFMVVGWSPILGLLLGGFIGGLGFALLYAILFYYLWYRKGYHNWYEAYRANPFEVQAYKLQDKYVANPESRPWGV